MQNRTKAVLSILVFSLSLFMMFTTKRIDALGDYLLNGIGLRAWTGNNTGFHLTILYFGAASMIAYFFVRQFAIEGYGMRGGRVFLLTVIFLTCFYLLTDVVVIGIKGNSEGLLSIGYEPDARISFRSTEKEITSFQAELQLTNYSNEDKEFYLTILFPMHGDYRMYHKLLTKENEPAIFRLEGKESRLLELNLQQYNVVYQPISAEYNNAGGQGSIPALILTDKYGTEIELSSKNFFGLELAR